MKLKNITFEGKLTCQICKKTFNHLGSHVWHKHKMRARDYKAKFNLPYNIALISEDIYEKKVNAFNEHREKYLKNLTNEHSFSKGHTGQRRISDLERKRIVERINTINDREEKTCPVCNMKFKHMESHLYTKHKLIIAK